MVPKPKLKRSALVAFIVCLALGYPSSKVYSAPPVRYSLKVAVAPIAERRVLTFPDSLPLNVEDPYGTLTAQPRHLPEDVRKTVEKYLGAIDDMEVVKAPELPPNPSAELVRAVAQLHHLDALLVGALTVGYGQMQAWGPRRRTYVGQVQVALDVLSGRTGRALTPTLVLEGYDKTEVNFRRRFDFDTLHHMGAGPEIRQRTHWAVQELGKRLKEKISATWLSAVLREEDRFADTVAEAQLTVEEVSVEPSEPRSGQTARMVVKYRLRGLALGDAVSVTESRRLLKDGRIVAGPFETVHTMGNGLHTSAQDLHLPETAEPGRYTIIGSVESAGAQAEGSGDFQVYGK